MNLAALDFHAPLCVCILLRDFHSQETPEICTVGMEIIRVSNLGNSTGNSDLETHPLAEDMPIFGWDCPRIRSGRKLSVWEPFWWSRKLTDTVSLHQWFNVFASKLTDEPMDSLVQCYVSIMNGNPAATIKRIFSPFFSRRLVGTTSPFPATMLSGLYGSHNHTVHTCAAVVRQPFFDSLNCGTS